MFLLNIVSSGFLQYLGEDWPAVKSCLLLAFIITSRFLTQHSLLFPSQTSTIHKQCTQHTIIFSSKTRKIMIFFWWMSTMLWLLVCMLKFIKTFLSRKFLRDFSGLMRLLLVEGYHLLSILDCLTVEAPFIPLVWTSSGLQAEVFLLDACVVLCYLREKYIVISKPKCMWSCETLTAHCRLYVNWRFLRGIEAQFLALQKGFNEVIPQHLLKTFDEKELEVSTFMLLHHLVKQRTDSFLSFRESCISGAFKILWFNAVRILFIVWNF